MIFRIRWIDKGRALLMLIVVIMADYGICGFLPNFRLAIYTLVFVFIVQQGIGRYYELNNDKLIVKGVFQTQCIAISKQCCIIERKKVSIGMLDDLETAIVVNDQEIKLNLFYKNIDRQNIVEVLKKDYGVKNKR